MGPDDGPRGTRVVEYGPLELADLDDVVDVHGQAFPESLVTRLGPAVVRRYYRWQFTGPHPAPYALGARLSGDLVGFVFGGLRHKAVAGFVRGSLPTIAVGAFTHPLALRHLPLRRLPSLVRLMVYRRPAAPPAPATAADSQARAPGVDQAGGSFGVLSIAVAPRAQGTGVADGLLRRARAEAVARGHDQMHLTVQVDNHRAIAFYERSGWERRDGADGWSGAMLVRLRSR